MAHGDAASSWRSDRAPIKYSSPVPRGKREASPTPRSRAVQEAGGTSPALVAKSGIELEPSELAALTSGQRADLRLWAGRVNLLDRVSSYRWYAAYTVAAWAVGVTGFAFGVGEAPPLVLSPIVPIVMSVTLTRRGRSLRTAGLRLRRVLFARSAR